WKSGFHRIARATGMPVVLGYVDRATMTTGLGPTLDLSDDLGADMDRIRAFYADKSGYRPSQRVEPRLREEGGGPSGPDRATGAGPRPGAGPRSGPRAGGRAPRQPDPSLLPGELELLLSGRDRAPLSDLARDQRGQHGIERIVLGLAQRPVPVPVQVGQTRGE